MRNLYIFILFPLVLVSCVCKMLPEDDYTLENQNAVISVLNFSDSDIDVRLFFEDDSQTFSFPKCECSYSIVSSLISEYGDFFENESVGYIYFSYDDAEKYSFSYIPDKEHEVFTKTEENAFPNKIRIVKENDILWESELTGNSDTADCAVTLSDGLPITSFSHLISSGQFLFKGQPGDYLIVNSTKDDEAFLLKKPNYLIVIAPEN